MRTLMHIASPTYRYFGLKSNTSLSTNTISIMVDNAGGSIKIPELDLVEMA